MTQASYPIDAVITCIDGSSHTEAVLNAGIWCANNLNAPLGLLHAHDKNKDIAPHDYSGSIGLGSREYLLDELAKVDAEHAKIIKKHGQVLLKQARDFVHNKLKENVFNLHRHETLKNSITHLQADTQLVILGQKGQDEHGAKELVGSQLEAAIRSAHVPVLVVSEHFKPPKTALYAFDNRSNTKLGLKWLAKNTLFRDVHVHVVYVGEETEDNAEALRRATAKLKQAGMSVTKALVAGKAKSALIDYQKTHNLDALIMGAYGHSRIHEFFMGSTTQVLLRHNQNATLLLRF